MGAILFYSYCYQWFPGGQPRARTARRVANGLVFGTISAALMISRIDVGDGVFVDVRNAPVALVALFEGPWVGALAALLPAAYRLSLGGSGMVAGLVALALAVAVGAVAHARARRDGAVTARHAFALGAAVFATTSLAYLLAGRYAADLYARVWLPLLVFYVLGLGLAARLMQNVVEQARLRAAQQRFRDILDEAPVGIRIIEPDSGRILEVNRMETELSGRTREEMLGRRAEDFWPSDPERRRAWEEFAADRTPGATARAYGLAYPHRGGAVTPVDATRRVVEHAGHRYEIAIFRDATEREGRERAEREAAELRAINLLAGATAHEINNPLVVVLGSLELVQKRFGGDDPDGRLLQGAVDGARRIRDIVARMMRITRVEVAPPVGNLPPILDIKRSTEEV